MANVLLDSAIMQEVVRDENNVEELVPAQLQIRGVTSIYYNAKEMIYTIIWKDYRTNGHPECISRVQINKEGFLQYAEQIPDILYDIEIS